MGGWVWHVGKYSASFMDYDLDELPEDGFDSPGQGDTHKITVKVKSTSDNEKEFQVPASTLFDIKKYDDGMYGIDFGGSKTPADWLFAKLTGAGVEIIVTPRTQLGRTDNSLYLSSDIFDENIIATTTKKPVVITSMDQLRWLGEKGFDNDRYGL